MAAIDLASNSRAARKIVNKEAKIQQPSIALLVVPTKALVTTMTLSFCEV